jgi:type VI secretion system protein ImpA
MFIDTRRLLKPISELEPSGPNLEYAPEFSRLERAAQGTRDQQMGAAVLAGDPPDPRAVLEQASALFDRTKDLRIALYLQRALLTRHGLLAFLEGLSLLRCLLDELWDTVHPHDLDDPEFSGRANVLGVLVDPELIFALRRTPLFESRAFGPITFEDIAVASGGVSAVDGRPTMPGAHIDAGFREQEPARLAAFSAALVAGQADVAAIEAAFHLHSVAGPDLRVLSAFLAKVTSVVAAQPNRPANGSMRLAPGPEVSTGLRTEHVEPPTHACPPEQFTSRHDVIRTLNTICDYYRKHEPSSPLPLLLERCQRLAMLDFIEIVKELSPDALPKVELIAGRPSK